MAKANRKRPPPRPARFWVSVLASAAGAALLITLALDWKRALERPGPVLGPESTSPPALPAVPEGEQRLEVRVVDSDGEPVRGALVFAAFEGRARKNAQEFEPGRHSLTGLPSGSVEIVAEVSGNRYHQLHDGKKPDAVIELPAGGRVAVDWSLPPELDLRSGRVMLVFEPRGAETDRFEVPVPPASGNRGSLMVPYVVPGAYLAQLEHWKDSPKPGSPAIVLPLTAPLELSVRQRALSRIALGLPAGAPAPAPPAAAPAPPPAPKTTP